MLAADGSWLPDISNILHLSIFKSYVDTDRELGVERVDRRRDVVEPICNDLRQK